MTRYRLIIDVDIDETHFGELAMSMDLPQDVQDWNGGDVITADRCGMIDLFHADVRAEKLSEEGSTK